MRRTSFIILTALGLAISCAAPAFAEKWRWFPIKGGAVAFDEESFKSDIKSNSIAANTVVFYEKPRTVGGQGYVFQAERSWFECLGARYRWSQSSVLDEKGGVVVSRPDGIWGPLSDDKGSAALFQRMLCLNQFPPGGKEAPTFEALLKAVQTGVSPAAAPKAPPAAAPEPKAAEAKTAPLALKAPEAKAGDAKTAKPLDLDALANSLLKTSEGAPKGAAPTAKAPAPAAKTAAPAPKVTAPAPKTPAPAAKTPTTPKVEPKLRPTTTP